MRPATEVHDALATLFSYPQESRGDVYSPALRGVAFHLPELAPPLEAFATAIADIAPGPLEELYTRTFDNVAERSLEVGWQLFGEQYARGALLVRMRDLLRLYGVPEETELPDHLTHVLRLLGRAPADLAAALVSHQVLPSTEKMLAGLRAIESPWCEVLEATRAVLSMHVSPKDSVEVTPS